MNFKQRLAMLSEAQESLLSRINSPETNGNGIYQRWRFPVITREHVPLNWRYDFDPQTNPHLVERIGVNSTFNAGAIFHQGRYLLVVRVEGNDRKSFFAVAESTSGVDQFRFWPRPVTLPENADPDTNVYDMRLTEHEDGRIYGLFCTERKDPSQPDDPTAATAQCGIATTTDLVNWKRLPDLQQPWKMIRKPAGHLIAPRGAERVGDVSNVVFSGGWVRNHRDEVFIYYGSSDTRMHVATSTVERLVDYCMNTPEDGLRSATSVKAINQLIDTNESLHIKET